MIPASNGAAGAKNARNHGAWRHLDNGRRFDSLSGHRRVDVAIVGGGFTGLSAALHLAKAGRSVAVLEADQPGFGASGRNGGQVIPGLKYYPKELEQIFGPEIGRQVAEITAQAADLVFALIAEHGIDCTPVRTGWVQSAHHVNALARLRSRYEQLRDFGAPVRWMDRPELAKLLGTDVYYGGWVDERAGTIQPLSYAQGLARAATGLGVEIFGGSRATSLDRRDQRWVVGAAHGSVEADWVVVGTNGYTDALIPGLRHTIVTIESAQVATTPLQADVARSILPTRVAVSDSRRSLFYFRMAPDNRFVMGGRGGFFRTTSASRFAALRRMAQSIYPQLAGATWEEAWSGKVAMTRDHLPHLHEPAPRLLAALGYNGRGIAMGTLMGRVVAEKITSGRVLFPITPVEPIPLPLLHKSAATAVGLMYRTLDKFM